MWLFLIGVTFNNYETKKKKMNNSVQIRAGVIFLACTDLHRFVHFCLLVS